MLLWTPVGRSDPDDDEKGGKLQKQANVRVQNSIICLAVMTVVFLISMVHLQHSSRDPGPANMVRSMTATPVLPPNSIYRISVMDVYDEMVSLKEFAGKVTLVVNTACKWGKTRLELSQLALLHETYEEQGFSILAFPSNDFFQELDNNEDIHHFLQNQFPEVTFPIFGTTSLKENPVYQELQRQLPDVHVQHNFFKYLVGRDGVAVALFHKKQDPFTLRPAIEEMLKQPIVSYA
jgi:glutathione peroxidase